MAKAKRIKSLGQISSTTLVVVGIIVVVIAAIVVIRIVRKPPPPPPVVEEEPGPVYEVVVGDIKFKLGEIKDRGDILKVSESKYPEWKIDDITTTERFLEVTIAVENIGKDNIERGYWDVREVIDSEERKFYSPKETEYWTPEESQCGTLLKPGFTPTLCIKIYEVAKISTGLKARVFSKALEEEVFYVDLEI